MVRNSLVAQSFVHVFSSRWYRLFAVCASVVFLSVVTLVPLLMIPSNTIKLIVGTLSPLSAFLILLLAVGVGISLAMSMYVMRSRFAYTHLAGNGGVNIFALLIGTFVTSCGCGLGFVFGALGLGIGSTTFLLTHQILISVVALVIVCIGIHMNARAVQGVCRITD